MSTVGKPSAHPDPEATDLPRSILLAAAIVAAGVLAGIIVGGAFGGTPEPTPTPTPSPLAVIAQRTPSGTPLSIRPATPNPTPTPIPPPTPQIIVPTPAPDGIPPPMPRIEFPDADREVVGEIGRGIDALADLESYRFMTLVSGRSIADLSTGGLDVQLNGSLVTGPSRAVDTIFGFRMVEFDCSAATSSSSRIVVVGEDAWSDEDGQLEPIPGGIGPLLDLMLPAGVAERALGPFAGGFERVGREARGGVPATRYRATDAGIAAYQRVTGIDGTWSATAWVADAGHLLALKIEGEGPGDCDALYVDVRVRDVNDPAIVITRPS